MQKIKSLMLKSALAASLVSLAAFSARATVAARGKLPIHQSRQHNRPESFPSPFAMRSMASSSAWLGQFPSESVREWHVHDSSFYYDLLAPHCSRMDVWDTEYLQILPDAASIVEWYRGSGLRPFLDALPSDAARDRFTAEYTEGIRELYPPRSDGRILFPFLRRFVIAYKTHAITPLT